MTFDVYKVGTRRRNIKMNKTKKFFVMTILIMIALSLSAGVMSSAYADSYPIDFSNENLLELESETYEYTGNPIVINSFKYNGIVLTESDYTAVYENNINASLKGFNAKIAITGKGNYSGILIKEFTIIPKTLIESCVTVEEIAIIKDETATTAPIVRDGEKVLTAAVDYTIGFENNKGLGIAKVIISGIGNYKGTVSKTFEVRQNNLTLNELTFDDKYIKEVALSSEKGFKDKTAFKIEKVETSTIDMEKRVKIGDRVKGSYKIEITENDNQYSYTTDNYVSLKIRYSKTNRSLQNGYVYTYVDGEILRQDIIFKDGYFQFTVKENTEFVLVGNYEVNSLVFIIIAGSIFIVILIWLIVVRLRRTIIFKENGGFVIENITKIKGTKLLLPICQRSGYSFNGWYLDQKCTVPFKTGRMPKYDINLYAAWIKKR